MMDTAELESLIKQHLSEVYNFIYRLVNDEAIASDLTQETWVKVWRYFKQYDHNQPFKPWLFKIAKNTTADYWRKRRETPFSILDYKDELGETKFSDTLADETDLPDELLAKTEIKTELKKALGQLAPIDQEIILLHQADDLTFNQIGEILGQGLNTVKSRYRRAMLTLRRLLTNAPN